MYRRHRHDLLCHVRWKMQTNELRLRVFSSELLYYVGFVDFHLEFDLERAEEINM
jgi:hypothetical protein